MIPSWLKPPWITHNDLSQNGLSHMATTRGVLPAHIIAMHDGEETSDLKQFGSLADDSLEVLAGKNSVVLPTV